MARLMTLVSACSVFWALTALPVRYWTQGELVLVYSGTAMLLCLVPGVLTLVWAGFAFRLDHDQQLVMVLAATGVRMFSVLLVALLLYLYVPFYRIEGGFLIWLIVFYLFTLALEMYLLLQDRPRIDTPA
jgi:hypothetical protein